MKMVKKYIFCVPLLLVVLFANVVNADDVKPKFKLNLKNTTKAFEVGIAFAEDGKDITPESVSKGLTPGQNVQNQTLEVADPSNTYYSIIVTKSPSTSSHWNVTDERLILATGKKLNIPDATKYSDFSGSNSDDFPIKLILDTNYDSSKKTGAFTLTVSDKSDK